MLGAALLAYLLHSRSRLRSLEDGAGREMGINWAGRKR
jgi:hypothetical protein